MLTLFFDVCAEFAFADCLHEGSEFVSSARDLKFNPPVGQVPHPTDYIEAFGDVFDGIAEADALHVPAEENLLGRHSA